MTAPLIARAGEDLAPAPAPARARRRAAPSLSRDLADLGAFFGRRPAAAPSRHRAPSPSESFEAVLERELAAHGYSIRDYFASRGMTA